MTNQAAPRLTDADITALIDNYGFYTQGSLTICIIVLKSGATVTGESRPISDANFDEERGRQAAYNKAREKIWELEGYAVRRDLASNPAELSIAGFTIGYCDDGSAYLEADNRPGEEGVSVRIDHLSDALSGLYIAAKSNLPMQETASGDNPHYKPEIGSLDAALGALDLPEGDLAAKVIAREQNLEADNDCGDACKI